MHWFILNLLSTIEYRSKVIKKPYSISLPSNNRPRVVENAETDVQKHIERVSNNDPPLHSLNHNYNRQITTKGINQLQKQRYRNKNGCQTIENMS